MGDPRIDALFANQAKAAIHGKGSYFEPGVYRVKVKKIEAKLGGFNGDSFISEWEVLESTNPEIGVGSTRSFVMNFTNKYLMADTSLLVMALLGHDPSDRKNHTNQALRDTVQKYTRAALGSDLAKTELGSEWEEGMFNGIELKLECASVPTKPSPRNPNGGTFTQHAWSPIPEQAAA
jgi:hypothetical protein